ncbi:MAG: hypothetical protein U0L73_12165 [Ruminococcus bromii]|nr:hypothetical protein [Ruminococcus bromii]
MSFEKGAGTYRGLRLVNDVAPFMYNMSRVQSISSSDTDYLLSVYDLRDSQRMGSYFLSELDTGRDIAYKYQSDKYSYADFMAAAVNAFERDDVRFAECADKAEYIQGAYKNAYEAFESLYYAYLLPRNPAYEAASKVSSQNEKLWFNQYAEKTGLKSFTSEQMDAHLYSSVAHLTNDECIPLSDICRKCPSVAYRFPYVSEIDANRDSAGVVSDKAGVKSATQADLAVDNTVESDKVSFLVASSCVKDVAKESSNNKILVIPSYSKSSEWNAIVIPNGCVEKVSDKKCRLTLDADKSYFSIKQRKSLSATHIAEAYATAVSEYVSAKKSGKKSERRSIDAPDDTPANETDSPVYDE